MKKKTRQRWPQRLSQRLALAEPVEQATPAVRPRLRAVIAAVSCLALVGLLPANARAIAGFNTIVVTRADDPSSGGNTCSTNPITDSDCSLRNALADAADGQTVSFRDGVTGPYRVTQPKALDIGHNVHLSGLGAGTTTIEGSVGTGVIKVDITATDAAISGVTITGGNNGAPPGTGIGGGIFNMGTLTISDSVVTLNKALFAGGGIESRGMLTVIRSTISDNAVGTPNSSGFGGGTEIESGSARFVNSTISGNVAMSGLSTPPGVVAAGGGLAILGGTLELANVTLADNTVSGAGTPLVGGNLWTRNGISVVRNTIIAAGHGPAGAENCGGHLTSLGHNIEDRDQCGLSGPGDQVNTDPQVGLLQDNGGPTPTQAPAPDSPAIDHGDPSGCADLSGSPLSTDQRGAPRPQGVACDAGAYELQPVAPAAALRTPTAAARSATLLGTIDTHGFPTTWHFDYGPTSQYGSSTPDLLAAGGIDAATAALVGLRPATTYHYRLVANTSAGAAQTSDGTFTTLPTAPDVTTQGASAVTPTAATLAGLVTPNGVATTYQFWYGPSPSYGSATPPAGAGAGTSAEPVTFALNGLRPNTTYHYELIASNSAGVLAGGDRTFTTGAIAPTLSALTISPAAFPAASDGASITRHRAHGPGHTGATVSYTDNQAALTTFTIERVGKHHHVVVVGHFTLRARPGRNQCHFTGRVNGGKLAPGHYILLAVATAQLPSRPVTAKFQIIR